LAIMSERYPNIHSLIISKDNCLVYEDYFYGWKSDDIWLIQSVTKSFTSALTGIALARGEIKSLDATICQFMKNHKDKACNTQNRDITIRQLLTMSTGLNWNELEFDYYDGRNTANQCGRTSDPFNCLLSREKENGSSYSFAYNSLNHLIVNMALRQSKMLSNRKELMERLLVPLGIEDVNTGTKTFGVIGDIAITPRSMVKFGTLFLNNGVWNGKPVIPSSWINESTSTKVSLGDGEGYGYFWWTKKFKVANEVVESYYAWGYGGQYIFVVPADKIVVTMTASNWIMDEKKYAFEMMERYILPALVK
jgi:CubicO group peptidase (beta-lactamase class C family)